MRWSNYVDGTSEMTERTRRTDRYVRTTVDCYGDEDDRPFTVKMIIIRRARVISRDSEEQTRARPLPPLLFTL